MALLKFDADHGLNLLALMRDDLGFPKRCLRTARRLMFVYAANAGG